MKKMLIIDGNSIINRAFYGIRMLTNKHGLCTNGIYGFLNIFFKNTEELEPDYVAVAFDLKSPTFRHKMYTQYKAQRKGMPPELAQQMPVLKEVLSAMNVTILEKEGYEADDIIGTVSRMCKETGTECYILTGDKDDLQLATDTTKILLTVTKGGATTTEEYDSDDVEDKFGVTPTQFVDVKGLMGDTSDNVPGVKGIGEKTAFEYIKKFKSIEELYRNLDDKIIKPAARQKLIDGEEMAHLSKTLCTIDKNVPLDFAPQNAEVKPYDESRLTELFVNLEFGSFLKKLGATPKNDFDLPECEILSDLTEASKMLQGTDTVLPYKLYFENGEIAAISFEVQNKVYFVFADGKEIADLLKLFAESGEVTMLSSDIKADMVALAKYDVEYSGEYFDTSVGAYIINPLKNAYDIPSVAMDFLSVAAESDKDVFGSGKSAHTIRTLPTDTLKTYASYQTGLLKPIMEYELGKIAEYNQQKLLNEVELPLVKVLASMETEGFLVDCDRLRKFNDDLKIKIDVLEKEIYSIAGEEFNINSPKQLGVILFEKLGLKAAKKTKTGYSTNAEVLEKLRSEHEIVDKILDYRQLAKLKSTYGDGLLAVVDPNTGRIYSKFNQTVTVTGRISSTEPNLQNIPVRTELGREIRKTFVAKDGCELVDADYSQIELRVLAHIANDTAMTEAFKNNEDIHTATAKSIFGVPSEEVTSTMRSHAKTINFGIVYGMGDFSLAKDLSISVREARDYIESYFAKYEGVKRYMDSIIAETKLSGYTSTLFDRRRPIPEINSSNFMVRSSGERMARNTPIQGTAADIIKIAMVLVHKELSANGLKARLILQVHDELIIETPFEETDRVKQILKSCMEKAVELNVPLVAEMSSGHSWYDAK